MRRILLALLLAGVIALQPTLPWGAASADSRGQLARTVALDAAENTPVADATPALDPSATPTPTPVADATPTLDPSATPTPIADATPTLDPSATSSPIAGATPTLDPSATPTADPSPTPDGEPTATPSAEPSETPEVTEFPMLFAALEATGTAYDLEDIARSLSLSIEVNGVPYVTGTPIARDSAIKIVLVYRLQNEGGSNDLTALDTLSYVFPAELNMSNVSGDVYDGSTKAGTFSISNNVLSIQLLQSYLDASGTSEMRGTVRLSGSFKLAEIADGSEHFVTFPGGITIQVTFNPPKVTVQKTQSYIASTNEVRYTIQVTADANVTDVVIRDTFGGNLTYVAGSVSKPEVIVAVDSGNPQNVTFTVPSVGPATSPYTFTYKATIADEVFQKMSTTVTGGLTNTIKWYESGSVEKTASVTTPISDITKTWVNKTVSWANESTGLINWTVTVNNHYPLDMYGVTITDTIPAGSAGHTIVDGSIVVTGSVDTPVGTLTVNADKKGFTYLIQSHTKQKYTFTYQTQIDAHYLTDPGSSTFSNKAEFTAWGKTYSDDDSLTRTNDPGTEPALSKTVVGNQTTDYATYTADWTIKITAGTGVSGGAAPKPKTLYDEMQQRTNQESWINVSSLVVQYEGGGALVIDTDYTVAWTRYGGVSTPAYGFTITFTDTVDASKNIIVTYTSSHNGTLVADESTRTYRNNAAYTYNYGTNFTKYASASWRLDKRGSLSKSAGSFRRLSGGEYVIDWTIVVNRDNSGGDNLGDRDYGTQAVTVVDTLPAGLTYLAGSAAATYKSGSTTNSIPPGVSVSGSDVTFTLATVGRNTVTITFSTVVDPPLLVANSKLTFSNSARMYVDGALTETKTAVKEVTPVAINKTGSQTGFLVDYKIDVNKLAIDLADASDSLTLTDTLKDYMLLSTDNVHVRDGVTNAILTAGVSISYNSSTRVLSITVPDQKYVIVEYSVQLTGTLNSSISVSNTVELSALSSFSSTYAHSFVVLESDASIRVEPNSIRLIKIDANDITKTLSGAEFTLWEIDRSTGERVEPSTAKTTNASGVAQFDALKYDQLYVIVETKAPNGYAIGFSPHYFAIPGEDETDWATFLAQIALVFGGTFAHEGGQLQVTNVKNRVEISKVAITGGPELPGAHLKIMDGATVVDSWVSGSTPHVLEGVLVGGKTYTLVEEIAPDGYIVAASIPFTVSTDGTVDRVEMVDEATRMTISKVAITGGPELPGAHLKVMDGATIVDSWVSGTTPHEIVGELVAGKTYTLVEEIAPDGYVLASSINFTVNANNSVNRVEMVDEATSVAISKVAITGGPELPGATLKVMDGGTVVESWVSGTAPHVITAKLVAGKTYTLVEESPPAGYAMAVSINFTVSSDGSVDRVEMVDKPTDVEVSKRAKTGTAELTGATLRLMDGLTVVERWVTGIEPHRFFAKLVAGKTYTLVEESAPSGYKIADSIEFTVNVDGSPQMIVMLDSLVSKGDSPKTGDDAMPDLWLAILTVSTLLLFVTILMIRRRGRG